MSKHKARAYSAFFFYLAKSIISLKAEAAVEKIAILCLLMTNKECIGDMALQVILGKSDLMRVYNVKARKCLLFFKSRF